MESQLEKAPRVRIKQVTPRRSARFRIATCRPTSLNDYQPAIRCLAITVGIRSKIQKVVSFTLNSGIDSSADIFMVLTAARVIMLVK